MVEMDGRMSNGRKDSVPLAERVSVKQAETAACSTADSLFQKALVLHQSGQISQAEVLYRKVLQVAPNHSNALQSLGVMAFQIGKHRVALELIDKAIQISPRDATAHHNRGNILSRLQQYRAALESYDNVIGLRPDFAEAYLNRGCALFELYQYRAALESFDRAISLAPNNAEAHGNRGTVLSRLLQYQAALKSLDKAIELKPNYADAYNSRGNVLSNLHQYEAALESFSRAIQIRPNYEYLQGMQLHTQQLICDWEVWGRRRWHLEACIDRNQRAAGPFITLSISGSAALQKKAAEIWVRDKFTSRLAPPTYPYRQRGDKIRVGYFSANYNHHAVSSLIAELFERHDRSRFETLGFSFGPDVRDQTTDRISMAMDKFVDVRSLSDWDVVKLSRELQVDIAVDLMGFTKDNRAAIFAGRAAPIQVNYLGYPGTMGANFIDYLIADRTLIPEASQRHYSEKIVYLPDSYQVNDSRHSITCATGSRGEEGLPDKGFVYCCFNNNYKITPATFEIWMRILGKVEDSVLWLLEDNAVAARNLRKQAARCDISPERLIFARRVSFGEHLARHRLADLFLDTLPYNAHTTASDALRVGLPLLTCMGEAFAGRVAASLLRAVGLPDLITTTAADYEALAVEIARNAELRHSIKERLQSNILSTPLFDTQLFTYHLEAAYSAMYERYHRDLPLEHIYVDRHPGLHAQ